MYIHIKLKTNRYTGFLFINISPFQTSKQRQSFLKQTDACTLDFIPQINFRYEIQHHSQWEYAKKLK